MGKWGRRKGGNDSLVRNRFCCCPSFCEGRDQTESGPQAPRRAALPSRVKNRPANLSIPPGCRWGVSRGRGCQGILPPALSGCEPGLAEGDGSFLLRALIPWQGWRSSTPGRGVGGTRQSPAPRPVPRAARAARRAGGRAGLLGGSSSSSSSAAGPRQPRAGGGHQLLPPAPGHSRAAAALFGPAARNWARRSRRGWGSPAAPGRGLSCHAHGSR